MEMMKKDPKSSVLEELMSYLDSKDGEMLKGAIEPKSEGLEVTKIKKIGDDGLESEVEEEGPLEGLHAEKEDMGEMGSSMSPEEMDELIEAIKSKIG